MKPNKSTPILTNILKKLTNEEKTYLFHLITRDPLSHLYGRILTAFILLLSVLLLWPFDFSFPKKNSVRWIRNPHGLEFFGSGQVLSTGSTKEFCRRLQTGTGLSVEVWVATADTDQTGPARIVSYSQGTRHRNFTLGQENQHLAMRLRTTETNLNGVRPHLHVEDIFATTEPQHIVVTYDFSDQCVYINGKKSITAPIPAGHFDNWNPSYNFVIGNEASRDRPWLGKIFYLAVYNRPLGENEVRSLLDAGYVQKDYQKSSVLKGIVARYCFDEGVGDRIQDTSGKRPGLDLTIAKRTIDRTKGTFLSPQYEYNNYTMGEVILNIVTFIPMGFLLHALFRTRYRSYLGISVLVVSLGALMSLTFESFQYFSLARHSSSIDVLHNSMGTALGLFVDRFYSAQLKHHIKSIG